MQKFTNISKFSIFTRSEQLPFVSRVNAILPANRETDPSTVVVFCEKTNVRFLNYTSAALADKSHLVLRVIRKIYKKSSEIKRAKLSFLPQP